jgi:hypothetical protein
MAGSGEMTTCVLAGASPHAALCKLAEVYASMTALPVKQVIALLLRCAAKVKAEVIYTLNLKHVKAIGPKQARKIQTP